MDRVEATSETFTPRRLLQDAVILVLDNVANHMFELGKFPSDVPPECFPPFGQCWAEYSQPRVYQEGSASCSHIGMEVLVFSEDDTTTPLPGLSWQDLKSDVARKFLHGRELGFVARAKMWDRSSRGSITGPIGEICALYDKDRKFIASKTANLGLPPRREVDLRNAATTAFGIFLFGCAFSHCKNTALVSRTPSDRDSRKWLRLTGKQAMKHYILNIKQTQRLLREEGQADREGIVRALHICRGHFRTYDETSKLFGKLTGTYWIPSHTRGSASAGEVRKWYSVDAK